MTWHRCLLLSLSFLTIPAKGGISQLIYKYRTPLHMAALGCQVYAVAAGPIKGIRGYINQPHAARLRTQAHPAIRQFIIEKMNRLQVPHNDLQITIWPDSDNFGCSRNEISIADKYHDECAQLIMKHTNHARNPQGHPALTAEERARLGFFTVTIYHEIAHHKYQHHLKAIIIESLFGLGLEGLIMVAMKKANMHHAFSPHFLKKTRRVSTVAINYLVMFSLTNIAIDVFPRLQNRLQLSLEREADAFAFQVASKQELEAYIEGAPHDPAHARKGSTHPNQQERLNHALNVVARKQH